MGPKFLNLDLYTMYGGAVKVGFVLFRDQGRGSFLEIGGLFLRLRF